MNCLYRRVSGGMDHKKISDNPSNKELKDNIDGMKSIIEFSSLLGVKPTSETIELLKDIENQKQLIEFIR
jgi:hypothetical protein